MSMFNKGIVQAWFPTIVGIIIVLVIGGGILVWQYGWPLEKLGISKEIDTCKDVQDLVTQAECYINLAEERKDESWCEKIPVPDLTEMETECYIAVAKLKNDSSICEKITWWGGKEWCEEYFKAGEGEPYIKLLSPNGGEVWENGSTQTIRWVTRNIPSTNKIAVHIRRVPPPPLIKEGQEFDPVIFTDLENTGSKDWTILAPNRIDMYPEGNYIIEIVSYAAVPIVDSISDESDETFRIVNVKADQDETVDWKTYRSEEYGYEIKYPQDWRVEEVGAPLSPLFLYGCDSDVCLCSFDILAIAGKDGRIGNEEEIAFYREKGAKEIQVIIGGRTAIRFDYHHELKPKSEIITTIYFNKGDMYYRIDRWVDLASEHELYCEDTFNQILSTFRFLE
jgi:hypothetical protein